MLSPAFSCADEFLWEAMPADTNGVESLNKSSIDKSNRSKTLESCLDFTYRQDKKMTFEHLFVYSGLPISFQKKTVESINQANYCKAKQSQEEENFG